MTNARKLACIFGLMARAGRAVETSITMTTKVAAAVIAVNFFTVGFLQILEQQGCSHVFL